LYKKVASWPVSITETFSAGFDGMAGEAATARDTLPRHEVKIKVVHRVEIPPKVGFWGAASANVLNMIGVGPFLTIPLALAAMGGPQAILGWILGAFISLCDGMVWSELGSAMPYSGGPYHYLLVAFGPRRFGRLFSFLFLWQAIVLGPISIAGGAVGFAQYASYLLPNMHHAGAVTMAAAVCLVNTLLLYRNIRSISHLSIGIAIIVLGSTAWIIITGVMHFHAAMAFNFPPNAFHLNRGFFLGLGASTLIAAYDYGGYYNVCLIGNEVSTPSKTIPRSILFSIFVLAVIYLIMNISIIGVVPWREAMHSQAIVADFMVRVYGDVGGTSITILILIAAFGSVFAILLGYSRIPYAAAVEGQFFSVFARLHPKGRFPYLSVLGVGFCSALACLFSLESLITSLIVTQTLLQFAAQCVAVILLRSQKRETAETYRMPLFPLPALIALFGWMYIVVTSGVRYMAVAGAFLFVGIAIFFLRARQQANWPFGKGAA
jgi:amino acid transporter